MSEDRMNLSSVPSPSKRSGKCVSVLSFKAKHLLDVLSSSQSLLKHN